jgi:transcription initiation factor TFIIE subunit beta
MSGSSQYKFGVLAKIVKYMRSRHQEGDDHPLSLDEILDETNQLDVGSKVKQVSVKHSSTTVQLSFS